MLQIYCNVFLCFLHTTLTDGNVQCDAVYLLFVIKITDVINLLLKRKPYSYFQLTKKFDSAAGKRKHCVLRRLYELPARRQKVREENLSKIASRAAAAHEVPSFCRRY